MRTVFKLAAICLLFAFETAAPAWAATPLPSGPVINSGQALLANKPISILNSGGSSGTLSLASPSNPVSLGWSSFNISSTDSSKFVQSNGMATLNRVVGPAPIVILGNLQSSGRPALLNSTGTPLSPGALTPTVVSTGAFGSGSTTIFIEGRTDALTDVKGVSMLSPGQSIVLTDAKSPDIKVQITAPTHSAVNVAQLLTLAGMKGVASALTSQTAKLSATTAVLGENGAILLRSSQ